MSDRYRTSPTFLKSLANLSDQKAWARFVELYGPLIARFVSRFERDELEIEEAVQIVCIRVLKAMPTFQYDKEKGRFRSWLGVVTMHEVQRARATKLRHPTSTLPDDLTGDAVEAEWEDEFRSMIYEQAVEIVRKEVTEETWFAFDEQFNSSRNPSELAKELMRTDTWVYQAKSNVLNRLIEEVERLSDDSGLFLK